MCNINLFFAFLIIITVENTVRVQGFRRFYKHGKETVLALEGEKFDMECKADVGLTYSLHQLPLKEVTAPYPLRPQNWTVVYGFVTWEHIPPD
ncbi:hypothetical protein HF086_017120 [Spodoptera exigua]|uniref:Uncharacterized protein n=1 Tax=Spodoptera exigua TaxID=7107 RepID=A0A922SL79_SPOEX|nr:hypothetical protein HF086_017120 [Spodoptera exigua]